MRDLAKLALHIIATYPDLYKIFAEKEFTWNKIRQQNRNPLLTMDIGADGLKTGNIDESGYGLVGSAVQNGQRLVVVVNGFKTAKDRALESRKLLEWGFRAFESRQLFAENEPVGEATVFGGSTRSLPLVSQRPIRVLLPRGSSDRLSAQIVYTGPLQAPVKKGTQSASFRSRRGELQALELPLYAGEDVGEGSLQQKAPRRTARSGRRTVQAGLVVDQQPRLMRGRFITFEGGEGAGKSTQIARLQRRLEALGHRIVGDARARRIAEGGAHPPVHPERTRQGARARRRGAALLRPPGSTISRQLIRPALAEGVHVLCDRFADSTRAYQGARARSTVGSRRARADVVDGTQPDLTFILDLPAESASPAPAAGAGGRGGRPLRGGGRSPSTRPCARLSRHRGGVSRSAASSSTRTATADAVEEAVWTSCAERLPDLARPAAMTAHVA